MQYLTPIAVRRLRIAAARLRTGRRRSGSERAVWIAAKNYRRAAQLEPDEAPETIELPKSLVDLVQTLTPELEDDSGHISAPEVE
ncbi:hypothetical protein [Aureliella helgolandensis]|uniref:Uncharacterized protein n=1 Tax=Aureliella helgolandensis TaxID=2527968 RepID=A0A518G4R0_9BACT|nr:hypothetical protein [Aureliella helgolandensis]QDV23586.1 hypothetical protein Q31a_18880 [Aureliella helgolandensis]